MKKLNALICIVAVIALASTGMAATFDYPDFTSGVVSFTGISESSGTDTGPLFGPPALAGSGLGFAPPSFFSQAGPGTGDTTSGTLSMIITIPLGSEITGLSFAEFGNWSMIGSGAFASVAGQLLVTDLTAGHDGATYSAPIVFTPPPQYSLPTDLSGAYQGVASLSFDPGQGITSLSLLYTTTLMTVADATSESFIQKTLISGPQVQTQMPEPATMSILAIMGLGLLKARRGR